MPTVREELEKIGRTRFLGEEIVARKFASFVPVPETTGDWEEMPWLAGQGAGLVHEVRPAGRAVEQMMDEAAIVLARLQTAAAPAEVSS